MRLFVYLCFPVDALCAGRGIEVPALTKWDGKSSGKVNEGVQVSSAASTPCCDCLAKVPLNRAVLLTFPLSREFCPDFWGAQALKCLLSALPPSSFLCLQVVVRNELKGGKRTLLL